MPAVTPFRPPRRPRRRALLAGTAALTLVLSTSACGKISEKLEEKANEVSEAAIGKQAGRNRLAEHSLAKDIAALAQKLGAKPLKILDVTITESTFTAAVQDPKKPANVDNYSLSADGTWSAPVPVELIGNGKLEENVFPAEEVAWDKIQGLTEEALKKVKIEGAKLSTILVKRTMLGEVEISISVDGTRGSGGLDAGADGKVTEIRQN